MDHTTKEAMYEAWRVLFDAGVCPGTKPMSLAEGIKAALSAVEATKGLQADPVATVIKKGAERQWMSERLGSLPDGMYSLYLAAPTAAEVPSDEHSVIALLPDIHTKLIDAFKEGARHGAAGGGTDSEASTVAVRIMHAWDLPDAPIAQQADRAEDQQDAQAQPKPYDGRFDECIARDYAKHGRLGS